MNKCIQKSIEFTVPGKPCAKGRPRHTKTGHTYTPQKTVEYENLVKMAYWEQARLMNCKQFEGPVAMVVTIHMPIPASSSKRLKETLPGKPHTKKPDLDNVIKAISDGLNQVAFSDDAQICKVSSAKIYSKEPGVHVRIVSLDESEELL